jgi:endonuclease YncB( thermonuclease family)
VYVYNATVTRVHDGDTLQVDVDLGFRVGYTIWARVAGISARELSMPGGPEAAVYLGALLAPGTPVVVASTKLGHDPADVMSFDRYVMSLRLADGRDLATHLIGEGWAVAWDGKTRPVPYPTWPIPA